MKKSRKLMSILLVVAMLFTLVSPAMADDGYTITINNTSETEHSYVAYQIFAGTVNDKGNLGNITWGSGISDAGKDALGEAKTKAEALKTTADAEAFAKAVAPYLDVASGKLEKAGSVYTISGLAAGYYLVKDADGSLNGTEDAYTEYLLKVVKNTTAELKSDVPEVVKKVKDTNDSTGSTSEWQDSADHDINDVVPFQLTATLANNLEKYAGAYKVVFHDTLSQGLTFKEITSVKIVNTNGEITLNEDDYSFAKTTIQDDPETENMKEATQFTITIADAKTAGAKNSCQVIVEYTATLNNQAEIGASGNPNVVYLEYSNNPNWDGSGEKEPTGKTPEDKVIVFTYQTVINKVDSEQKPLSGAVFTLEKLVNGNWEPINVVETKPDTTFTFKGLDDGFYRLKETVTPPGYNTIDDIYFEIEAKHDTTSPDPELKELTATQKTENNGDLEEGKVTFKPTYTLADGKIATKVVNNSGATLPETGGIGTTIFYVIGGALVLGAAVLLATQIPCIWYIPTIQILVINRKQ